MENTGAIQARTSAGQPPPADAEGSEGPRWLTQRETASRNERAIVAAAQRLFADETVERVEMRDIAVAAGVGIGTLYRRFGDKASLLAAVIGEEEYELQEAVIRGKPPVGPGAPAAERLEAFLGALAALTERNINVLLATDSAQPGWIGTGAYAAWRLHVGNLLGELRRGLSDSDRGWYADALLAPLTPHHYAWQRRNQGLSAHDVARNLRSLARALTSSD